MKKSEHTNKAYRDLKCKNVELYRRCVECASAFAIHHNLGLEAAAELERSMVFLVLESLDCC